MSRPYETIEFYVPRPWVKRMNALAERLGVDRSEIVAEAVSQFLRDHKQLAKGTRTNGK